MAVRTVGYIGTPWSGSQAQDTERGPSPSIWYQQGTQNAWWADFQQDPRLGMIFWDDFMHGGYWASTSGGAFTGGFHADTNWYAYADENGTIADAGLIGGVMNLSASTTAHQGVALSSAFHGTQLVTSAGILQGRLTFECSVEIKDGAAGAWVASTSDMFVGLMDNSGLPASAVPITNTGGSLATAAGFIGFHKRGGSTNGTDFNFVYNVAGGTPQYFSGLDNIITGVTGTAPVAGTFYKLGFVFDPQAEAINITSGNALSNGSQTQAQGIQTPVIYVYVNGVPAAAVITKAMITTGSANNAYFPDTLMAPCIAFKQQSTTASVSADVDWVEVAQQAVT